MRPWWLALAVAAAVLAAVVAYDGAAYGYWLRDLIVVVFGGACFAIGRRTRD